VAYRLNDVFGFQLNVWFFLISLVEFAVLTLDKATKQPHAKIYRPAEVDALLAKHGLGKKEEDAEMRAA
jgi:hypothetical protein